MPEVGDETGACNMIAVPSRIRGHVGSTEKMTGEQ
jgi:hypothetical protein